MKTRFAPLNKFDSSLPRAQANPSIQRQPFIYCSSWRSERPRLRGEMRRRFFSMLAVAAAICAGTVLTEFAQNQEEANPSGLRADQVVDHMVQRERALVTTLSKYTPLVETYIQNMEPDHELGAVPVSDKYFLAKLDLKKGIRDSSLLPAPGFASKTKSLLTSIFSIQYLPRGFASMIIIDDKNFDRTNYDFTYVRREFLGEVRCFVFDVKPKGKSQKAKAKFIGRLWAEDRDFNIVRVNGTYTPSFGSNNYFHFDSWRENLTAGLWLPSYVYTEESNFPYFMGTR